MRLLRVKIYGFKTFAERTEIVLGGELAAIVGPNGCGKSNVVDAILWGLGETNARHLRAQTATEVIFSGSKHRKPLGYAEVTLVFDNSDQELPIPAAEVSITRRLKKSGDSDYAINGQSCRLRDVADLLADTGLGRAGYAIVGQSEIDQALAAKPEQRRAWIDEAAGVQRYRVRRNDAQRRLGNARLQLERVDDVLSEIERERGPLEEEARTARIHRELTLRLRSLEADLLVRDLHDATTERSRLDDARQNAERARGEAAEHIIRAQAALEALGLDLDRLEQDRHRLSEELAQQRSAAEQARAASAIAQGKRESLLQLAESLEGEEGHLRAESEAAEAEWQASVTQETEAKARLADLRADLELVDAEAVRLEEALAQAEAELAAAQALVAARDRAEAERSARRERLRRIDEELDGIRQSLPDLDEGVAEAERVGQEQTELLAQIDARRAEIQAAMQQQQAEEQADHQAQRTLKEQMAQLEGRIRGLAATLDSLEGMAQGAKAVLLAVREGHLSGDYEPVADAFDVEPAYAVAIETALGGAAHDLIVPDEAHARQAIHFLKDRRAGRATFQPLTLMRPYHRNREMEALAQRPGVDGWANDLVAVDERNRPVIDSLLGRVLVVDDLDTALALAKTSGWNRLVTRDGEVVHGSGAVSGGKHQRQGSGVVQRRSELLAAEQELKDTEQRLQAAVAAGEGREAQRAALQEDLAKLDSARDAVREDLANTKTWAASLGHERQMTERSQARLEKEAEELKQENEETLVAVDLLPLQAKRDQCMKDASALMADAQGGMARLKEAEAAVQEAQRRRMEAERRRTRLSQAAADHEMRASRLAPDREKYEAEEAMWAERAEAHEADVATLTEKLTKLRETREAKAQERMETERDRAVAQAEADTHAEAKHRAEVDFARTESRRAILVERLLEEYGMTSEEALERAPVITLPEDAAKEVGQIRREIRSLGEVNTGAIEAYERLTERYDTLKVQRDDVVGTMEDLESSMHELDRLTRTRFLDTFAAVKVAFEREFALLFPGGTADLTLSDPADALESGVDIEVTLPGKRRQRLDLLSGGERSLSAVAFLFALLAVKPTPLVILDEVDAPLDGRNVERYIEGLRRFTDRSQFLIITHNPVTIEAADVWFGVTMNEPGVSTLIPFTVPRPEITEPVVPAAFLK